MYQALSESVRSKVYLHHEGENQESVLVKTSAPSRLSKTELKNEFEVTKKLNLSGIRKPVRESIFQNRDGYYYEYIDGIGLNEFILKNKIELKTFIKIAKEISKTLSEIHEKGFIHLRINSHNIIIHPPDLNIHVIDFSLASSIKENKTINFAEWGLELSYIAPEQTGHLNKKVDQRTDLYSLGIVLYELWSGFPPFRNENAADTIHDHLVKLPTSLDRIRPETPPFINLIVEKLLSKNPDTRYQSAKGLLADILECEEIINSGLSFVQFKPGKVDLPTTLNISTGFYGRKKEFKKLSNLFDEVHTRHKNNAIILITGQNGIGKSRLAIEFSKYCTENSAIFLSSKLNQHGVQLPNQVVIDALKNLAIYILSQTDESLAEWKKIIQNSVAEIGQLLIDLVPEFAWILEAQPKLPSLNVNQAESRLNFLFYKIIEGVANENHPVVLFVDDMQWMDNASWKNLEILLNGKGLSNFILLGAYWQEPSSDHHEFIENSTRLINKNLQTEQIQLQNLSQEEIAEYLSDSFEMENLNTLIQLAYRRTGGNPFYLQKYLDSLYVQKHLEFNTGSQKWIIHSEEIIEIEWAENVISYLNEQVKLLPTDCMRIFGIASCLGYHFNKTDLLEISEISINELNRILKILVDNNLLNDKSNEEYHFEHETLHSTALQLLDSSKKELIHHKIANKYLSILNNKETGPLLYYVTDQFNKSKSCITTAERLEVVQLNYQTALSAKNATDYELAFKHYTTAISMLEKTDWNKHYALILNLHNEAAECGMKIGQYIVANNFLEISLQNAKDSFDRILAHEIKLLHLIETHQFSSSIEYLLKVLDEIGYNVKRNPSKLEILKEFIKVKFMFIGKRPQDISHLPEMTAQAPLAFIKLTTIATVAIFGNAPDILPIINFKQVYLSLKYGKSTYLPYAIAAHGFAITAFMGDLDKGHDLAKSALQMTEEEDLPLIKAKVMVIYYGFLSYWKNSIVESKAPLKLAYSIGRQTGDLLYATFALSFHNEIRFYTGDNLTELLTDTTNDCLIIKNLKQNLVYIISEYQRQMIINLVQANENPWIFKNEGFDELYAIQELSNLGDKASTFGLYHNKMLIACLFNQYEIGEEYHRQASTYEDESTARQINYSAYLFYSTITQIKTISSNESKIRNEILKSIQKKIKKLQSHSHFAPQNFMNKYLLLLALLDEYEGRMNQAMGRFLESIKYAKEAGFICEEAIGRELFSQFLLKAGEKEYGEMMLNVAYQCYNSWGAINKCQQLVKLFPQILGNQADFGKESTIASFQNIFDLNTIIKSNKILSSENNLDSLLTKMLELVMTNASCSKAIIIIKDSKGQLVPYALGLQEEISILKNEIHPLTILVPQSLILYVSHSKTEYVSPNLSLDKQYNLDTYVKATNPISVCCIPIITNQALLGIIYLENNLAENAFDKKRVEFFKTITSQLAISMENVALYSEMEIKVTERTSQLQQKNQELTVEKNKSDELLLNILPEEIATELKENGKSIAKKYEQVTILFSDIKDFTLISELMEAEELVSELDTCFKKFDEIIIEFGLEKIKTVGDAYLAVGGLPDNNKATALDVVTAAFKMVEFTSQRVNDRKKQNKPGFEIRVGINTGSVVSGIVGIKKFQFDIWGNAVNLAARLEQSSEPGRINISSSTYELIKKTFSCEYRGRIPAKGIGDIDMYFVNDQ